MEMLIDEHIAQLKKLKSFHNGSYGANINFAIDTMRKYQKLQADYENRLKADMVAILEDLDLQIDESAAYNLEVAKVQRLIRDRIDKLKESKE